MRKVGLPCIMGLLSGNKDFVALLIANNADVNTKIELGEYKGETPLDYAKGEITDLLCKHGGKTHGGTGSRLVTTLSVGVIHPKFSRQLSEG